MVDRGNKINAEAQILESHASPTINAQEAGGCSTLTLINNPPRPSFLS